MATEREDGLAVLRGARKWWNETAISGDYSRSQAVQGHVYVGALLGALSAAEAARPSGWRSVEAELPPVGERVLCLFVPSDRRSDTHAVLKFHGPDKYGWEWSQPGLAYCLDEVSHWMALPANPTASESETSNG